jgi:hypothetical protein
MFVQSAFVTHPTQRCDEGSQTVAMARPAQSALERQTTQRLVAVSQCANGAAH